MNEDYVSKELSRKLQEKGYPLKKVYRQDGRPIFYDLPQDHPDWSQCDAWYLPSIWEVLKWLREEKNLHIEIISSAYGYIYIVIDTPNRGVTDRINIPYKGKNDGGAWDDYNDCVLDAINNILDKNFYL